MITLKNVLLVNAVSSGATGLGLIIAPDMIAGLFETAQKAPFFWVGIFLLAFAFMVFAVSRKQPQSTTGVRLIIFLDCLWVFGSICIVLFQLFRVSVLGYLMIAVVAGWVGLMAFLQYTTLKKLRVD